MEGSTSTSSSQSLTFYDFLHRMRNPASLDILRSIKSFIVSFSFYPPNYESDGKRVQEFFFAKETAIRDHPFWVDSTDEEIDCAMEVLYVFLPRQKDSSSQRKNSGKSMLSMLPLRNSCIMNCCRVINILLLNAAMSENHVPAGADIKANPPQLHSNLKFIQLYRWQAKLISEAAYYFTNLVSAMAFIVDLNVKSLSMDEIKFEESMQAAKLTSEVTSESSYTSQMNQQGVSECSLKKMYDKLEDTGVFPVMPLESNYPYMEAKSQELTARDVDRLSLYKDLAAKYTSLCKAIVCLSNLQEAGSLLLS